jgi:cell wall-associated NlpC family hydrolase
MIGTMAFASPSAIAYAEEIPIAGIDLVLDNFYQNNENEAEDIKEYLSLALSPELKDISFAQVTNYVNIRSKASEDSEILGKLYNNAAATILENKGDWSKVKSGSVTGYIKSEFLIVGAKAQEQAKEVGKKVATVTTTTLKVREKASTEATVLTLVPIGDEFIVSKELDGWVKITYEGDKKGYISSEFVEIKTEFEQAVSIEEERERLEEEQAALETQSQNSSSNSNSSSSNNSIKPSTNNSSNHSSIRSRIADFAVKYVGNPYVWGGTSLTNGADCSGFTQSVFRNFGISIPRTSRAQAIGGKIVSISNMQPGDLIFYKRGGTINHVSIYIGNGKVVHASSPSTGIRISSYNYRQPSRVVSYIN